MSKRYVAHRSTMKTSPRHYQKSSSILISILVLLTFGILAVRADLAARTNHAAAVAAIESFMDDNSKQRPLLAAAMELVSTGNASDVLDNMNDLTPISIMGKSKKQAANSTVAAKGGYVSKDELTWERWGHTAAYMPQNGILLFTGGQVALSNGDNAVTNDVFAMNMNESSSKSDNPKSQWTRLSSKNLPPHAFAARAVTHTGDHRGEKLFLIGGATADCSATNSPVHVWSPSDGGQDWTKGRWQTPKVLEGQTIPPRRKGASAVQVPASFGLNASEAKEAEVVGGTAFMVLGGYVDYTTCNASVPANLTNPLAYPYMDVWLLQDDANDTSTSAGNLTVRTLPLNASLANMSVTDYATVLLPANKTANVTERVVFVGGRDAYGVFTPMNQLWTLDLSTSAWSRLQTTNGSDTGLDIPLGRMGHSSTLLADGTILIHGGYVTLDVNQTASNDTYVLDPRVNPAVWSKVTPNIDNGVAPRRAYHSAVMADGILVLGFGQQGMGSMADGVGAAQQTDRVAATQASSPVHILDTKVTWGWTTDIDNIAKMRNSDREKAKQADKANKSKSVASSQTASAAQVLPSLSNYDPSASSTDGDQAVAASNNEPAPATSKGKTAVIASVLGAAAILASLGGLYFAKRRQSRLNGDADSVNDDKYERFADSPNHPAPPVSSLWINQPMEWGRGLRRGASMASQAILARTRSTARAGPAGQVSARQGWRPMMSPESDLRAQTMHALPASSRRIAGYDGSMDDEGLDDMRPLPDDFIRDLLSADEDEGQRASVMRRPTSRRKTVRRGPSMSRNRSTDSLTTSSVDGASHFSYPYLTAMDRPSMSNVTTTSPPLSEGSLAREVLTAVSPREALLRASLSRSPGSQPLYRLATGALPSSPAWSSPGAMSLRWGKNARLNERLQDSFTAGSIHFDNPFLDTAASDANDQLTKTDAGYEDLTPRQPQSPLFPWESPQRSNIGTPRLALYQQPGTGVRLPIHPALLNAAAAHRGGGSARKAAGRSRPSLLRVTNETDSPAYGPF